MVKKTTLAAPLLWILLGLLAHTTALATGTEEELKLFVVEKSKNPQNILVVYCKVNPHCEFQRIADAGRDHLYDVYWLMDGTTYKRTHPVIKKMARKRFVPQKATEHNRSFNVLLTDLKELMHDLPSDIVRVDSYRSPEGRCRIRAVIQLGPSGGNRAMQIESIYSKARTILGIPIGIYYIELHGTDTRSREKITIRFNRNSQAEFDHQVPQNRTDKN
ncbi:MAG: hypothetical protein PVG41_05760 [Desulfobacteraceae bacterium]